MPDAEDTPMDDPAQHLLGGLNVAILIAHDSPIDQVESTRQSLEELGVTVSLLASTRAAVQTVRDDGSPEIIQPSQSLAAADPDAFDGVVVIASPHGGARLALDENVRSFLARMDAEGKPIGAVSDGVLPVMSAGLETDPGLSTPEHLRSTAEKAGVETMDARVTVDANVVSAADGDGLERFNASLKQLLAKRRCRTITPGNDVSSAVGEDG